jgi:glycosyltransferase involved in cell wall biosynthesis
MAIGFSVIIPVYNESQTLWWSVKRLLLQLQKSKEIVKNFEILLVENGSKDNTWQICEKLKKMSRKIKLVRMDRPSYGLALKNGILMAEHEYVVIFNADFWDVKFLEEAMKLMSSCDLVVGSKTSLAARDKRPWYRQQISYWFNALLRIVFNFPGTDTHGIKLFKKSKIAPLMDTCRTSHELFDTEIVLKAVRRKMVYAEIPITVREIRPTRYNNLKRIYNTMSDAIKIFKYKYLEGR